jgi:L-2-hydroxyglutarate oxidase LhgO
MFFDLTIIGAGVVGLSIAKSCSELGMTVVVLEKDSRAGEGISSRNSGVIHAGIYYPNESLKTKLCLSGNKLLYDYAKTKNIDHKRIGKYIIASSKNELEKLEGIYKKGVLNSVTLDFLNKEKMKSIYPDLNVEAGIYSPNTGIIDVPELINALEGDIQHNNGLISLNTKFISAQKNDSGFTISCDDGNKFLINSKYLINASGLNSDLISQQIDTLDKKYYSSIKYAKGHYFKYSGSHPFTTLVYPLASEFSSGLHVGFDLSGQIRFGPDITWVDDIDYSFDESLKDSFMSSIIKYWPDIESKKLHPDYVGIRPKLQDIGEKMKDFSISDSSIHGVEGLINIQGLESPGISSSLAIGEYVKHMINSKDDPLNHL